MENIINNPIEHTGSKGKEIKRFDVLSVAKIHALLTAVIGFFGFIFMYLIAGAASAISGAGMFGMAGMGAIGIIVAPILYGILGFIIGLIGAAVYNLVASWVGGIVMEFKDS